MKKICYVVTIPLTIRAFFIPQLKYLAENGFDVTVICGSDDVLQSELGEKIHFLPVEIPRGISFVGSIKAIRSLKEIFLKEKFDLVQYSTPNAALYASIAAKSIRIPVRIYHLMGLRYLGAGRISRPVLKAFDKYACSNSTSIECVSKSNLELGIQESLYDENKATVIWNGSTGGVDLERFDFSKRDEWRKDIRNRLGISEDDFVIGFVGRITKDKGVNELLEAFFNLEKRAKLLIIGNDEGVATLNQILWKKANNDENIIILDFISDIEKYYPSMDVLVLPSYREGFGNVVIEAQAMGTPAIVSNIPGPVDAIEIDKTGLIVNKGDAEDLKNKLEALINKSGLSDAEYCSQYIKEHFDSQELCKRIAKRKNELLNG